MMGHVRGNSDAFWRDSKAAIVARNRRQDKDMRGLCLGLKRDGNDCSRKRGEDGYCYQHRG